MDKTARRGPLPAPPIPMVHRIETSSTQPATVVTTVLAALQRRKIREMTTKPVLVHLQLSSMGRKNKNKNKKRNKHWMRVVPTFMTFFMQYYIV